MWNKKIKLIIAQSHISIAKGGFSYKLNNDACTIIPYPAVELKRTWQVYITSELKIKLFRFFTMRHGMNFHSCEKQIFKSFGCTKIHKDSRWTKTSLNEVMQPTSSNNGSRSIFPYHVHNQADFDDLFINGRGFICLGSSKINFSF